MKKYLAFVSALIILSGCAASSINVLQQKETTTPFSKLLLIYIDGALELNFLDSSTYNICVKEYYTDSSNVEARTLSEKRISDKLSGSRLTVVKYSDLFDSANNSYDTFLKQMDSIGVDGILIINRTKYVHKKIEHQGGSFPSTSTTIGNPMTHSSITVYSGSGSVTQGWSSPALDAGFKCYLIKSGSYFPVWIAEFALKGKDYSNKNSLKNKMSAELSKSLKNAGYISK